MGAPVSTIGGQRILRRWAALRNGDGQATGGHRRARTNFAKFSIAADTAGQSYFRLPAKIGIDKQAGRIKLNRMIYFIDILGSRERDGQPEILSRIIDHEPDAGDAMRKAASILAGVSFVGADAVRVLDRDGIEIFSWKPDIPVNC